MGFVVRATLSFVRPILSQLGLELVPRLYFHIELLRYFPQHNSQFVFINKCETGILYVLFYFMGFAVSATFSDQEHILRELGSLHLKYDAFRERITEGEFIGSRRVVQLKSMLITVAHQAE